jgi:hypothetical protein
MEEGRLVYRIWGRFLRERDHFEDPYLDKRYRIPMNLQEDEKGA